MRIGLISDTHLPLLIRSLDQLGPQIGEFLATVDLILHGGDVIAKPVLDWCEQFAPVLAARGNNDVFEDSRMQPVQYLEREGWRIAMTHDLRPEDRPIHVLREQYFDGRELDIIVAGDTHVERLEYREGVVLINSGSPTLPHHKETRLGTLGLLELEPGRLRAEIIPIGETDGARNPGTHHHLELRDSRLVAASRGGEPLPLPVTDAVD